MKNFRITFQDANAATMYFSMAEGMWTNARDDNETDKAARLDGLLNLLKQDYLSGPKGTGFHIVIPGHLGEIAGDVLDNCLDNYGGEDEDTLSEGDVLIAPENALTNEQRDAIVTLIERVRLTFDELPEDEAKAIEVLDNLLAQDEA